MSLHTYNPMLFSSNKLIVLIVTITLFELISVLQINVIQISCNHIMSKYNTEYIKIIIIYENYNYL